MDSETSERLNRPAPAAFTDAFQPGHDISESDTFSPAIKPGKRVFDLLAAVLGLLFLSPLLLTIALIIKLHDGGPVLFRQLRVGQFGRPFKLWKFRSMVPNASELGEPLTVDPDPRITSFGHFLRRYKLDELPQLFNVLAGEMTFVGPRPEVHRYVALYTPQQLQVLTLRPGITDPASIEYINESKLLSRADDPEQYYIDVIMPDKIRLSLAYAERATRLTDIWIILQTLSTYLRKLS